MSVLDAAQSVLSSHMDTLYKISRDQDFFRKRLRDFIPEDFSRSLISLAYARTARAASFSDENVPHQNWSEC